MVDSTVWAPSHCKPQAHRSADAAATGATLCLGRKQRRQRQWQRWQSQWASPRKQLISAIHDFLGMQGAKLDDTISSIESGSVDPLSFPMMKVVEYKGKLFSLTELRMSPTELLAQDLQSDFCLFSPALHAALLLRRWRSRGSFAPRAPRGAPRGALYHRAARSSARK